jgi:uncharacterized protein (DUF2062 family)
MGEQQSVDEESSVGYVTKVRDAFELAVSEELSPHLIALSFAFGIFLTAMPNLGVSVAILLWIGHRVRYASQLAFVAAITVMNPIVKGAVYTASFLLGVQLLGSVGGINASDVGLDAGQAVLVRLLVGNFVLAVVFAVVGYVLAYATAVKARSDQ